jgi:hypothetical protein
MRDLGSPTLFCQSDPSRYNASTIHPFLEFRQRVIPLKNIPDASFDFRQCNIFLTPTDLCVSPTPTTTSVSLVFTYNMFRLFDSDAPLLPVWIIPPACSRPISRCIGACRETSPSRGSSPPPTSLKISFLKLYILGLAL